MKPLPGGREEKPYLEQWTKLSYWREKGQVGLDPEQGEDGIEAWRNNVPVLNPKVHPEKPCASNHSQGRVVRRQTNPDNYQQIELGIKTQRTSSIHRDRRMKAIW